ncbi:penicillin-binding protein 2 [Desulfovibrio sp. OttesenSCG-928-O18]|nr:penicillin-binding protein 2 [Desulfovibrio sp. OttesenSCG-928-O18]
MNMEFDPDGYQPPRAGIFLLYGCVAFLFIVFLLRFWYLQVLRGADYARQAQENRLHLERIYSNRGLIFDRHGRLLAENRPAYCIAITADDCPDIAASLTQISQWSDIPVSQLEAKFNQGRQKVPGFEPMLLVSDIPFETLTHIEMQLPQWPGVSILTRQRRHYPQGPLFSHILGYVAEANEKELEADKDLDLGDIVGKQGLELGMEKSLRGKKGLQELEVNAKGRQLARTVKNPPHGGTSVTLSLDLDIQQAAADILGEEAGSIVVMEPETGQLVALLTKPAFDNNAFAARLTHKEWETLRTDPRHPLLNRGIQSVYPPGSVWKLMMAGLVLSEGISPKETVTCNGSVQLGNHTFRCWRAGGHGRVDLTQSLVQSCDVYYYQMSERIGIDKLAAFAKKCGFGSVTGIDLPHEQRGLVPDRAWRRSRGETWQKGETLNVSIGQGSTLVTPIQLATFVSALLNGGKKLKPSLIHGEAPEARGTLPMTDEARQFIVNAMRETVEHERGTAKRLLRHDAIMGGKTGTAQVVKIGDVRLKSHQMAREHRDHAWMATWGMKNGKTYVVVVMLEHGGGGSSAAGPLAVEMYKNLFGPIPTRTASR